mmetsp:Transcript_7578/g.11569  ORF Transcript_7578/g.11569 Transcript_7578/m.11569 type:complete len:589 (-) Transcript_7578:145-1911(-)
MPFLSSLLVACFAIHFSEALTSTRIKTKPQHCRQKYCSNSQLHSSSSSEDPTESFPLNDTPKKKKAVVIGAGWGGLSAAYSLSQDPSFEVTVVDAAPRVGGLVRDGFKSISGKRNAEAGQHGFWDCYYNIFSLLKNDLGIFDNALTGYAEQGQYSPNGLEAVWPIYRDQSPQLPTGLAQAAYTKFLKLPLVDRLTAFPLVLAFSEFDDSVEAWERYDKISFRDLCVKLGVSKRCYEEAFEPMILTGLFAPGAECSAAAALGMAYFFVLSRQNAFDVRWCKGNIGEAIFDPWMQKMKSGENPVKFQSSTRVTGFQMDDKNTKITGIKCSVTGEEGQSSSLLLDADTVIFSVGASALNAMVRNSPQLANFKEFRRFANLRGTSVLATRLYLDRHVPTKYSANACWGFDEGVGMTFFNIGELHDLDGAANESIIEVDYYHADTLMVMSDDQIVKKVKQDLDTMLGASCAAAEVTDAAVVRLPSAVNWYFPDSYKDMPDLSSSCLENVYFAGDLVRTRHGSWSQEKAFVAGIEAANLIRGLPIDKGVIPLPKDEAHVAFGRSLVKQFQTLLSGVVSSEGENKKAPSLVDFLF